MSVAAREISKDGAAAAKVLGARSLWERLRRDIFLLGAGNLAVVVAQLGFRSLLVGSLAPAAYGRLSLVLSIYNTVWIIGASGLPNSVSRYIAKIAPGDDSQIIRAALRASVWPVLAAATVSAVLSAILLETPIAGVLGAVGIGCLVYSLLTMGILRGRGRIAAAAAIMPVAACSELLPLAALVGGGFHLTPLLAFAVFSFGNAAGLATGVWLLARSAPRVDLVIGAVREPVPGARELLGSALWLGAATMSLAMLPLALRAAAALDSYTVVAVVDVALVLFALPQRLGAVVVMAVTPHVSRAISREGVAIKISSRTSLLALLPFALAAALVAFTPLLSWLFGLIGRPVYARSANYLALALLAGPARVLYGVVEGVLIAHGKGRVMALTAGAVCVVATGLIFAASAFKSPATAFAIFVLAYWAIYLLGVARVERIAASA
jgi:O-antigen/teichoic acid export membrane protein